MLHTLCKVYVRLSKLNVHHVCVPRRATQPSPCVPEWLLSSALVSQISVAEDKMGEVNLRQKSVSIRSALPEV